MAEWFANMNIALYRIDTAGKTTKKTAEHKSTLTLHCGNFLDKLYSVSRLGMEIFMLSHR